MNTSVVTTLTSKGQITIPKRVREVLGVKAGDKIEFEIEKGVVKIKPALTLEASFGRIKPHRRPEDFRALRKFFEEKVAEEAVKEG